MNPAELVIHKWLPLRLVVAWATIALLVNGATPVEANPFSRFLYSVRHRHHRPVASHRRKRAGEAASAAGRETASVRSDTMQQNSAEPQRAATSGTTAFSQATNEAQPTAACWHFGAAQTGLREKSLHSESGFDRCSRVS